MPSNPRTTGSPAASSRPRRRPINGVSLVFGVIFCGISGGWFLFQHGALSPADLGWVLPAILGIAGIVGLAVSLRRGRTTRH